MVPRKAFAMADDDGNPLVAAYQQMCRMLMLSQYATNPLQLIKVKENKDHQVLDTLDAEAGPIWACFNVS